MFGGDGYALHGGFRGVLPKDAALRIREIVDSLLEEIKEEYPALKLKYFHLFNDAEKKDRGHLNYHANPLVQMVITELLEVIAVTGKEIRKQYYEVYPTIGEITEDKAVLETYPRARYMYNPDSYKVFNGNTELTKAHIESACYGSVPEHLRKVK